MKTSKELMKTRLLFTYLCMLAMLIACVEENEVTPFPPEPKNVKVMVGDGQIEVNWDAVTGVKSYEVYYDQQELSKPIQSENPPMISTGTTTTIIGLTNGTTYYVWVRAINSGGKSNFTSPIAGTPLGTPPSVPQNVILTAGEGQIEVHWDAITGAESYEVYYDQQELDNPTQSENPPMISTSTTATIIGLTNGTTYYVWVRAINSGGESNFTSPVAGTPAVTLPSAPQNVILTAGEGQIEVHWDAINGAEGYIVYYDTSEEGGRPTASAKMVSNITSNSYIIQGLTGGTTYYIWAKAENQFGQSDFSTMVSGGTIRVFTFAADADTRIVSGDPPAIYNWGASPLLRFASASNALFRFNVTGLTDDDLANIEKVELVVTLINVDDPLKLKKLRVQERAINGGLQWIEGNKNGTAGEGDEITFANSGTYLKFGGTTDQDYTPADHGSIPQTIPYTLSNNGKITANGYYTFAFKTQDSASGWGELASKENSNVSARPYLKITIK